MRLMRKTGQNSKLHVTKEKGGTYNADKSDKRERIRTSEKYNKEEFHILHALTVEGVMRWYAGEMGFGDEADFWALAGLLHDVDFEQFPEEHCKKAPELLAKINAEDELIHAVVSHGYGLCSEVKPEHLMEKIMFASDELTGLIWAAAKMRPSKSVMDMEVSSVKKNSRTRGLQPAVPET